jgi:D-alanyl-lipoteichoic acid acyltransferase DltB (MBOAT superfamily)
VIFTSYTYLAFLACAFPVYWLIPPRFRNPFLVFASYAFYCSWKWQFGFLLLGLSVFNWWYGRWILPRATSTWLLVIGVSANLSALIYFKYTNFLLVNAAAALQLFGSSWQPSFGDIVLPLGISFFTFQGIAYLFDVATGEPPLTSLLSFLVFKGFWPQLIAGPIIRLSEIRHQIEQTRTIKYEDVAIGCRRILFGFFKKVVLADNLAPYVDMVFLAQSTPNFLDSVVGILGFGLQIYFDFSAYSDIAIGTARLFGFVFPENFNWPYSAVSPRDFWNRWHMTLSRWIRDYVYTPLAFAGRRRPRLAPLWLLIAMALCGLWHGAQWTFVVWGIWHGLLLVANETVLRPAFLPAEKARMYSPLRRVTSIALTFVFVQAGWLLFRARDLAQAGTMLTSILTIRGGLRPALIRENIVLFVFAVCVGLFVVQALVSAFSRRTALSERFAPWFALLRPVAYAAMIVAIVVFDQESKAFVYFQF